jgi:tetratricopeptide (TPR) repeat protein
VSNSRSAEAYAHLGVLAARRDSFKEAVPLYRKALALGPDLPDLRLNLGLALFKGGHPKESIGEFSRLLHSTATSQASVLRARLLIGMAYYAQGEYATAVPYLKGASAADPQNLELLLVLAHSCLWTKQTQCVLDTYKEILSINPESAGAYMLAGEALDEMKDNEGSTKMFRAAVAANPKEPNVHFGLGYLLWTQKQYPEALQQFQAELENDPTHAQSLVYLGDCYLQLNNSAAAMAPLKKGLALDHSIWLASLDLGIIDSDAGRNDDALHELKEAAKLKPDDVNVHWRLGRLLRTMGRKQEAQLEFDAAKKLNKAADEDLYKKIANGAKRNSPAGTQTSPPTQ